MKMRMPPAAVNDVIVSPANVVASKVVTRGSANMNELRTVALTWLATWNQMK